MSCISSLLRKVIRSRMGRESILHFLPPEGAVLMFHHVSEADPDGIESNQHLKVSASFLEELCVWYRKKGFSFLSMDEVTDLLQKKKPLHKVLALTFDDGYRDNLTVGKPVLSSLGIPFIIYVATGFLTGETVCFWDLLEQCILRRESLILPGSGENLFCRSRQEKEHAFLFLRDHFLAMDPLGIKQNFTHFLEENNFPPEGEKPVMISPEELTRYKEDKFLRWGCHSHTHLSFAHQPLELLEKDLLCSVKILKDSGVETPHFAFPYGDGLKERDAVSALLKRFHFRSAVTSEPDLLDEDSGNHLLFLPRLFVSQIRGTASLQADMATLSLRKRILLPHGRG